MPHVARFGCGCPGCLQRWSWLCRLRAATEIATRCWIDARDDDGRRAAIETIVEALGMMAQFPIGEL
jgi:hypothetical protein